MNKEDYLVIGKIGSVYGIKGWIKITPFTESIEKILDYNPWYLSNGDRWEKIELEAGRQYGKGVIVKIPGSDTPETSKKLTGKMIAIRRDQLPSLPKEEYYWRDLEGLTVIDQHEKKIGVVIYLMETGSNDVLVVKSDDKEYAIPYLLKETVRKIDLVKREIHVDWDLI